jgi:hypothetical protein
MGNCFVSILNLKTGHLENQLCLFFQEMIRSGLSDKMSLQ